jgi:hypothetical protein
MIECLEQYIATPSSSSIIVLKFEANAELHWKLVAEKQHLM